MSSLEYDSQQNRAAARRPPPVVISEPALDSPGAAARITGAVQLAPAGPMMLAVGPSALGPGPRLPPSVAGPLAALAGPISRQPLLYTGDATGNLDALRQDVVASYRAVCGALGEPARTDLMNGNLPAAAVLGLPVPAVLPAFRLPPLVGGTGPLLLIPPPPPPPGQPAPAVPPGQAGSAIMGLGPDVGIEGVGSGADAPASIITATGASSAAGGRLLAEAAAGSGNPLMGALRSLSAGHASASGLPPLGRADGNWPLGRPSGAGGGGASAALRDGSGGGPRIAMLSGFSRPQDPGAGLEFLGEESAVVYPPPGRSFGGAASAAARAALGGPGLAQGQAIDAMDDFRFRSGSRKHIKIEDLDNPSRLIPRFRRDDEGQLELFLKEYARDHGKPKAEPPASSRYRMPF